MRQMNLLLIVAMYMFAVSSYAQRHYSMLEGNPEWVYYAYNCGYTHIQDFGWYRYYVDGDTILDGITYKKVMLDMYDVDGNRVFLDPNSQLTKDVINYWRYPWTRTTPYLVGFLREEDDLIRGYYIESLSPKYRYKTPKDIERTQRFLYDFRMQVGDTIIVDYPQFKMDTIRPVVDRYPITLADGSVRNMILLHCCSSVYSNDSPWKRTPGFYNYEIIEGVGCINAQNHLLDYMYVDWTCKGQFGAPDLGFYSTKCSHLNMFKQFDEIVYLAPEHNPVSQIDEKYNTFHQMPFYPDITPTSIRQIHADANVSNKSRTVSGAYNVMGQKLSVPQKGLNIVDGEKVLFK